MAAQGRADVVWLGRGGQGAFTAARILGAAHMLEGGFALAFPSFGPERRGAPMRAFTKLGARPITDRSEVSDADYAVVLDETLFDGRPGALVASAGDYAIASRFGLPTVNTIMLARLAARIGIGTAALMDAAESIMPKQLWERNRDAIESTLHTAAAD